MDELTKFADWWMATRAFKPPADFYSKVGGNTGTVLFRDGPFQVQLFVNDPNSEIVDHVHPSVDSYEVYVAGDVLFRQNGKTLLTPEMIERISPARLLGMRLRIRPTEWHGASVGPRGGTFISIQHWLNERAPTSVHLDWDGPPLDQAHAVSLRDA